MKNLIKKLSDITFVGIIFFYGCSENDTVDPIKDTTNGFESVQLAKIFSENCATSGCHAGSNPQNGLSLETYSDLLKGSLLRPLSSGGTYSGEVVVPYNSEKSLLYQMIKGNASVRMPFNRAPLSEDDIKIIKEWIDNGAVDDNGTVPFSNPSYRIFVCNQKGDAISEIDGDAKLVSRVYDTNFSEINDAPHMVKVFGDYFYVTYIANGSFVKFNKKNGEIVGKVEELEFPGMIMITSDGKKAFVSRSSSAPGSYNSIYSINLQTMTLINEILLPVNGIPHGIVLSPDDKTLYVANLTANRISVVDAETDSFVHDLSLSSSVDHEPMQTAISPDGKYLYVSARATGKLLVIDTEQLSIVKEVTVGMMPMHVAVSSDGSKIYVPSMMMNNVSLVEFDGTDWIKTKQVTNPAFVQLHGCVLSPGDDYLYVSSRNVSGDFEPAYPVQGISNLGTVGIINTQTFQVEKIFEIEEYGAGMALDHFPVVEN